MTAVGLLPMHGVGLVPTVSDVVEQAAHARILSTFLSRAKVVIHNFVYNVVRDSTSSVWNPDKEETNMLWEAVSVCWDVEASTQASLHSILTFTRPSFTHLMTKSMSLLAMVTITSGTLYGVFKWLSMVALTPPKTKVKRRRLCYGKKMKLYKQTDCKN